MSNKLDGFINRHPWTKAALAIVAAAVSVAALIVVLTTSAQLGHVSSQESADHKALKAIHLASLALDKQCQGQNVLRAQDNSSHLADFNSEKSQQAADKAERDVYSFIIFESVHALNRQPPEERKFTVRFVHFLRTDDASLAAAQKRLLAAETIKTWTPLVNCTRPTFLDERVLVYKIQSQPPPWYALGQTPQQLQNSTQPNPIGSR